MGAHQSPRSTRTNGWRLFRLQHIGILDNELFKPYFEQNLVQCHKPRDMHDIGSGLARRRCYVTTHLLVHLPSSKTMGWRCQTSTSLRVNRFLDYGKVAYSLWNSFSNMNDQAIKWLCDLFLSLTLFARWPKILGIKPRGVCIWPLKQLSRAYRESSAFASCSVHLGRPKVANYPGCWNDELNSNITWQTFKQ